MGHEIPSLYPSKMDNRKCVLMSKTLNKQLKPVTDKERCQQSPFDFLYSTHKGHIFPTVTLANGPFFNHTLYSLVLEHSQKVSTLKLIFIFSKSLSPPVIPSKNNIFFDKPQEMTSSVWSFVPSLTRSPPARDSITWTLTGLGIQWQLKGPIQRGDSAVLSCLSGGDSLWPQ